MPGISAAPVTSISSHPIPPRPVSTLFFQTSLDQGPLVRVVKALLKPVHNYSVTAPFFRPTILRETFRAVVKGDRKDEPPLYVILLQFSDTRENGAPATGGSFYFARSFCRHSSWVQSPSLATLDEWVGTPRTGAGSRDAGS